MSSQEGIDAIALENRAKTNDLMNKSRREFMPQVPLLGAAKFEFPALDSDLAGLLKGMGGQIGITPVTVLLIQNIRETRRLKEMVATMMAAVMPPGEAVHDT